MPPRQRAAARPLTEPAGPEATITARMSLVMDDVGAVRKAGQVTTGPARFNFRGVDAVVNAVSPALRRHGVVVVPKVLSVDHADGKTNNGGTVHNVYVTVRYRFHGAAGDHIDAVVAAESFDSGDKATAKAMSVAYRTALLQALCLPTDDPTDPDQHTYERGPAGGYERTDVERVQPPRQTAAEARRRPAQQDPTPGAAAPNPAPAPTAPALPVATALAYRQRIIDTVHATAPGAQRDAELKGIHADLEVQTGALASMVPMPEPWRGNGPEQVTLRDFILGARGARTRADSPAVDPDTDQWSTPDRSKA